jgi:hypothetical protein
MNCQICGKPAKVHVTNVHSGNPEKKTEAHYCVGHASEQLSPTQAAELQKRQAAIERLRAFVKESRRVPTAEELHEVGIVDIYGTHFIKQFAFWKKFAEAIISESDEKRR